MPDHDATPVDPTTSPPFAALLALISLMADPPAAQARVREMQAAERAAGAAIAKLAAARAEHDRHIAGDRAELEAQRAKLRAAQVKLAHDQGVLNSSEQRLQEKEADLDRRGGVYETGAAGSTLIREFSERRYAPHRDEGLQDGSLGARSPSPSAAARGAGRRVGA